MDAGDATIHAVPGIAGKEAYTRAEVRRMAHVTERQLRSWQKHGLVAVGETFGFIDLGTLNKLVELRRAGVPLDKICLAVEAVRHRFGDVIDPLRELKVVHEGRRLRFEYRGQRIEPVSGQLLFDFDHNPPDRLVSLPRRDQPERRMRETAEMWFQKGLELEHEGRTEEAVEAYETAVRLDPHSAGAYLNLGTIYFNGRMWPNAETFYVKALEADPNYPLAHFNLANLYDERGDAVKALYHYKAALRLNPHYADAHYNLALLHQNRGRIMEAVRHWKIYLKLDPSSQWGSIARRELEKLKKWTIVPGRNASTPAPEQS